MKRSAALLGVLVLLTGATSALAGGAHSTRPGHGGGSGGSGGGSHGGAPPTHASGSATWRHYPSYGYGHGGYYPYYPYSPYYGWGWGVSVGWGWPYYGGYWYPGPYSYGYGYPYGYPSYVTVIGEGEPGAPAVVVTEVRPAKAIVRLDGDEIGKAKDFNGGWDVLRLQPGQHVLEFAREGYKTLQVRLDAKPGRTYAIRQTLAEGEGLDERSVPSVPAPAAPDNEAAAVRTEITGDEPAPPPIARGLLRVEVQPGDAAVYLDGEFLGRADELAALRGAIPVAEGTHRLEVVRPGRRSAVREVTVSGREPVRVRLEMEGEDGQ